DRLPADGLQTQPEASPTGPTELDVLQAWRHPGDTDAWLIGAIQVHAASTAKIDIRASWTDPVDNLTKTAPVEQSFSAPVDTIPLPTLDEAYLSTDDGKRYVGYYDPDHDLICCAPAGTALGELTSGAWIGADAAPCHRLGDPRHHVVSYTAVSTS